VQEQVIARTMAGAHTLAVMPTGAGKSLCYQVPALAREGTALVISPLIALMHDQIRAADAFGIKAACLTSADSNRAETVERLRAGELDLLYVAPERATGEAFRNLLARVPLALIAIDEAHCVSEWGHDFRPDYRLLRPLLDNVPDVPRLALTATADRRTRADILVQLGIPDDGLIVAGFDRPNIRYHIGARDNAPRQLAPAGEQPAPASSTSRAAKPPRSWPTSSPGPNGPRSLSCRARPRRARAQPGAVRRVGEYGGGRDHRVRHGDRQADVRFVAHAGLPKSIEAYYQETGRAGRDGDPSEAWLFWGASDFTLAPAPDRRGRAGAPAR
jgi:ATP-dependent DNA helicase RecQ